MMLNFLKSIAFVIVLTGAAEVYADSTLVGLDNYAVPAEDIFTDTPAPVDLNSYEGAARFKTKLTQGAQAGPNYAGHYTIVTIGCGTQCQDNWLIDAKTGKILARFQSMIGITYKKNSFLVIINPPDETLLNSYMANPDAPFWSQIKTIYQILKDDQLETIKQMKWTDFSKSLPQPKSSQPNSMPTTRN
ncbi:MAG: hypothetical protein JSR85_01065 [Proteobacteria bacterium]|nr:hypothetical protein [Pseudomonadota bacterium]